MLEDNISRLEQRIRELESAEDPSAIRLHNPYSRTGYRSTPSPSQGNQREFYENQSITALTNFNQEPPVDLRQVYLTWFFSYYGSVFGMFLNESLLLKGACSALPLGHPSRPSPALLHTIYYIISHLRDTSPHVHPSQNPPHVTLSQVLQQVSNMLSSSHPKRLIHTIQAEVLLSNYFFLTKRILEGKYHLNTAISLAAGAGLHLIRSPSSHRQLLSTSAIPTCASYVEEGERINAFWVVYCMSNLWDTVCSNSVAFDVVFDSGREGRRIDTPWPRDMLDYEQDGIPTGLTNHSTVKNFLASSSTNCDVQGTSGITLYSKATILFARATSLANSSPNNMSSSDRQTFLADFNHTDRLIDSFASGLPSIPSERSPSTIHLAVLTHTLTYAAAIQLHSVFSGTDGRSSSKSLALAGVAVGLLPLFIDALRQSPDVARLPTVDPAFGLLWGIVGNVLVKEVRRVRARSISTASVGKENGLLDMLHTLVATMEGLKSHSAFMAYQLDTLKEAMKVP
ncbi:hypothetical protein E1B28_008226 [Marasmius oreades]|uniref:Transcription factor domain-containing protein n=1 Tax=Marasmius oreades TaxID=181124 RepID=A0A9P7RYM3_9AGAR|nr:uncharacterized protein E1B28_008226 [Marasmius oreades]KAG7091822.1 hypothetical protein E1B28_008226 [Marasmius oreades]